MQFISIIDSRMYRNADSLAPQYPDPLCFSLYLVPNTLNTIQYNTIKQVIREIKHAIL